MHFEALGFSRVAPGAAPGIAAAALPGDSLQIKNAKSKASIIGLWGWQQVAGTQQIIYPSGHDTTRGYMYTVNVDEQDSRMAKGLALQPNPQETLSITIVGSTTAGDVEMGFALVYYKDLPGITMQSIDYKELLSAFARGGKLTNVVATITGTGVANTGGWAGAELINAETDLLKANTKYAVLGATTNTSVGAIWMTAPDFGNVRIAVPGDAADNDFTADYFCNLARTYGEPFIPVFNSGNKGAINIGVAVAENTISPLITWFLAELP